MAHLPRLSDPGDWRDPHDKSATSQGGDSLFSFTELTKILGQHGAGSTSEDLALDLLLHEIVTQACSAIHAAGAAIALSRDGQFVCRATTGDHAPDLGSPVPANSGLSGACVQSRQMQRCDDTESDDRVDAAACRSLGVRSVLVVPMLRDGMVIGILEAFSPRPDAFTDRDVQALRTLAGRVLETMSPPPRKEETVSVPVPVESDPVPVPLSIPVRVPALVPHKDPWMPVLGILILALALLLGWMLGHRTWTQSGRSDQTSTAAVPAKPATQPVDVSPSPTAPSPLVADRHPLVVPNPKMASAPPGELVVYENGKLVYEEKPRPATVRSRMVQVPFSKANALLIQRVEPLYPDQARESRTQGTVVLQVDVSEQGTVRELRTLSGDPQLAGAASDAIRQWRFRPYAPQGQALSFQTQVTMDFKLP